MSYDPNTERFTYIGYDGQWHVREYSPEEVRQHIAYKNRVRLLLLEERARTSPLSEPETQTQAEVRNG